MFMQKKHLAIAALIALVPALLISDVSRDVVRKSYRSGEAKYVFLLIGDGMAMPQINAAEAYLSARASKSPGIKTLTFSQFPQQGMVTTYDAGRYITDSASAGTAMYTGQKTLDGVISMDASKSKKLTTVFEQAKSAGKKIGIVSSVSIDHATPACTYAHMPSRNDYYEISLQLSDSGFDYFGGGGFKDAAGKKSKMTGEKINAVEKAKKAGYVYADNKKDIMKLTASSGKVIAVNPRLDKDEAFAYAMDNAAGDMTLADFTRKGIEILDNPKGFAMMIEGGKIDWACHANDAAASIHDTIAFDDAVKVVYDFYKKHTNDTLIVVVGDHETGGMSLGFAGTKYETAFDLISNQKISFQAFDAIFADFKKNNAGASFDKFMPVITKNFGLGSGSLPLSAREKALLEKAFNDSMTKDKKDLEKEEEAYLLYGGYEPISVTVTHVLNQKAGIAWTTYSHTGVPVPIYAVGKGAELFTGYYDNTDIAKNLMTVCGINAVASK